MAWTLCGIQIHPDNEDVKETRESLYALQQVVDATHTTKTFYGAASRRIQLRFKLDEDLNSNLGKDTIESYINSDSDAPFVTDQGETIQCRILQMEFVRLQALNKTYPFYQCQAELIEAD